MTIAMLLLFVLVLAVYLFMQTESFGAKAVGTRLERMRSSPNYNTDSFQNFNETPSLTGGATYRKLLWEFFFVKHPGATPSAAIPSRKTDLQKLQADENVLVWFGHSSYFIQVDGKKILADPVFSGHASPFSFTTRSFAGSDIYSPDEMPAIDLLFLSHDHFDHLDYKTVSRLRPKIKQVITGLGTGAHLERWGFDPAIIIETDWDEQVELGDGFSATVLTARHFSGRKFKRNENLWISLALTTPTMKLYLGGDSGNDTHFAEIGNTYGPFDLAILECGQYNQYWKHIHMMPEETVQASADLRAKRLLPVHWAKFRLGLHPWDEPIKRATAAAEILGVEILHPMIGEKMKLKDPQTFNRWWEQVG